MREVLKTVVRSKLPEAHALARTQVQSVMRKPVTGEARTRRRERGGATEGDEPNQAPDRSEVNQHGGRGVCTVIDMTDTLAGAITVGRRQRDAAGIGGVDGRRAKHVAGNAGCGTRSSADTSAPGDADS